jgi:hypothetical protein
MTIKHSVKMNKEKTKEKLFFRWKTNPTSYFVGLLTTYLKNHGGAMSELNYKVFVCARS